MKSFASGLHIKSKFIQTFRSANIDVHQCFTYFLDFLFFFDCLFFKNVSEIRLRISSNSNGKYGNSDGDIFQFVV